MKQIVRVLSNEYDSDDQGHEWRVYYVLYETQDDDGATVYDLYDDDGAGNGTQIARCVNVKAGRSLTLKLGEFVEWAEKEVAA